MSDMWTTPDQDPRNLTESMDGELATYRDYLSNYRLTIGLKCEGLDAEQLARRSVPPSTMSLLGLLRHLAQVEHNWFTRVLQQRDEPRLYRREGDRDWDWNGADADDAVVADARETWQAEIAAGDAWLDGFDEADLGTKVPLGPDGTVSVRDVLVHLIEEYARHAGHADLLRECIDGRTGQ